MHGDETLPYLCPEDQPRLAKLSLQSLVEAQIHYRNNSSPHTYTGEMTDLVNGTGIGDYPLICRDLNDSLMCNYNYQLTASEPSGRFQPGMRTAQHGLSLYGDDFGHERCIDHAG